MIKGTADFFAINVSSSYSPEIAHADQQDYRDGYVTNVPEGVPACLANLSDPTWPVCNQVK
jgi:hypothetical protein